jgi:hypothetical protein
MMMVPLPLVATSKTRWAIGSSVPIVINAGINAAATSIRPAMAVSSAPLWVVLSLGKVALALLLPLPLLLILIVLVLV